MKKLLFSELSLSPEILKAVEDMGFEEATPIQSLTIPYLLKNRDVVGQAQTGTGKTAAFGIPILETLDTKIRKPQAIVMCPTRELAIQVAEELTSLAKYKKNITILPIYGGQPIGRQLHVLSKGVQIVIGTPGRMIDHLQRGTLVLDSVKIVVLDEADEMLDMGFRDDIEIILKTVPKERQMAFFSATMPRAFMELTARYQKNPHLVKVVHEGKLTVSDTEQVYFEMKEGMKLETLSRVIDMHGLKLSLVFCNTKRRVDEVVGHLQVRGYAADGIHGDMNQAQRDRVMAKFRKGVVEILVATDVAARGIDVEDIEAVFNYDTPNDEEYYVHRIGRTGRAGKKGMAFTFVVGRDIYKLREIQKYAKIEIQRKIIPTPKDVEQVKMNQFFDKVRTVLTGKDLNRYTTLVERLIGNNDYTSLDVAAALLKLMLKDQLPADKTAPNNPVAGIACSGSMLKLYLNIGKKHNIRPGDILGAIAGETGIEGRFIGNINIHDSFSFVEVPSEKAQYIISIMSTRQVKGNRITIEPAR